MILENVPESKGLVQYPDPKSGLEVERFCLSWAYRRKRSMGPGCPGMPLLELPMDRGLWSWGSRGGGALLPQPTPTGEQSATDSWPFINTNGGIVSFNIDWDD